MIIINLFVHLPFELLLLLLDILDDDDEIPQFKNKLTIHKKSKFHNGTLRKQESNVPAPFVNVQMVNDFCVMKCFKWIVWFEGLMMMIWDQDGNSDGKIGSIRHIKCFNVEWELREREKLVEFADLSPVRMVCVVVCINDRVFVSTSSMFESTTTKYVWMQWSNKQDTHWCETVVRMCVSIVSSHLGRDNGEYTSSPPLHFFVQPLTFHLCKENGANFQ